MFLCTSSRSLRSMPPLMASSRVAVYTRLDGIIFFGCGQITGAVLADAGAGFSKAVRGRKSAFRKNNTPPPQIVGPQSYDPRRARSSGQAVQKKDTGICWR